MIDDRSGSDRLFEPGRRSGPARQNDRSGPVQESAGSAIRLNKYIAESGLCSRREADSLLAQGRVLVDGVPAQVGQRVSSGQTVTVDGKPVVPLDEPVYLALHKPTGIICTSDRTRDDNIIDYIGYPKRIFTIGRLDRDSEGMILLTNDGDIVNKVLRGQNRHEKEYRVTVDKPLTPDFLKNMAEGVPILDTVTRPCTVFQEHPRVFRIVLTQGLNRQIRRMCEALGYSVERLVRLRVMHINLGKLPYGQYRLLTHHEVAELHRLTARSQSAPNSQDLEDEESDD